MTAVNFLVDLTISILISGLSHLERWGQTDRTALGVELLLGVPGMPVRSSYSATNSAGLLKHLDCALCGPSLEVDSAMGENNASTMLGLHLHPFFRTMHRIGPHWTRLAPFGPHNLSKVM